MFKPTRSLDPSRRVSSLLFSLLLQFLPFSFSLSHLRVDRLQRAREFSQRLTGSPRYLSYHIIRCSRIPLPCRLDRFSRLRRGRQRGWAGLETQLGSWGCWLLRSGMLPGLSRKSRLCIGLIFSSIWHGAGALPSLVYLPMLRWWWWRRRQSCRGPLPVTFGTESLSLRVLAVMVPCSCCSADGEPNNSRGTPEEARSIPVVRMHCVMECLAPLSYVLYNRKCRQVQVLSA
ncbi:hypothetical protein BKA70DRAFT_1269554 [Coprinopsis sp. MPI-PUGE-AT-0042]|nr:hypothetical protein BKA70DRAFT_1269554 [Coprinopsis sp. MPI-PUGE-AT-0042]